MSVVVGATGKSSGHGALEGSTVNSLIYLVGLIVVILAVLSFFGMA